MSDTSGAGSNPGSGNGINALATTESTGSPALPGLEGLMPTAPTRRANLQAIILVVVVVASVALLLGMRQLGVAPGLKSAQAKLNVEVPESPRENARRQELLLAELAASRTSQRVPVEQLRVNPFVVASTVSGAGGGASAGGTTDADPQARAQAAARARAIAERRAKLEQSLNAMTLHSVMAGSVPLARINSGVYRVGQNVDDIFTVSKIEGLTVTLTADGQEFILRMGVGTSAPRGDTRRGGASGGGPGGGTPHPLDPKEQPPELPAQGVNGSGAGGGAPSGAGPGGLPPRSGRNEPRGPVGAL